MRTRTCGCSLTKSRITSKTPAKHEYRGEVRNASRQEVNRKPINKPSSPFYEEEVKLEEKLKELEKQRNQPKVEKVPKDSKYIENIEKNWKPFKCRLIDIGVFDQDKTLYLISDELEKSISVSLEKVGNSFKDLKIEELKQEVQSLKSSLQAAYNKIKQLEREANNEVELDKILNSSFGHSDHKSLSFYGLPTKEAKSPVGLMRNMTQLKGVPKQLEVSESFGKGRDSGKYYKFKLRTLK